jgi:hypothetical protein
VGGSQTDVEHKMEDPIPKIAKPEKGCGHSKFKTVFKPQD